ncbi:DUF1958 domain-containing protein, partial [Staphylococcus aureus]|uniref:DUF1958 domain-containing protein n=1 Tax=Staphylococcus aureus TaxID=1280 RepID=UPI0011A5B5EB
THQGINASKYYVQDDLYDLLPTDFSKKHYKLLLQHGKLHPHYPTQFINKHYPPPTLQLHHPIIQNPNTLPKTISQQHPLFTIIPAPS